MLTIVCGLAVTAGKSSFVKRFVVLVAFLSLKVFFRFFDKVLILIKLGFFLSPIINTL